MESARSEEQVVWPDSSEAQGVSRQLFAMDSTELGAVLLGDRRLKANKQKKQPYVPECQQPLRFPFKQ